MIIRTYGDTDFITGLRAIAATMVVIMHTGALASLGDFGGVVNSAGKYGVDVFFVISGFTVAKTFTDATGYRPYLIRRLFRIVPLYWVMICAGLVSARSGVDVSNWMTDLGASPDVYNLVMHLSLLSYLDYRVANSVLGVEWTIPVEIFWYVMLPVFLGFAKTLSRVFGAVFVLAVLTGVLSYLSKAFLGTSMAVKWSPVASGHWFFVGAFTYVLRNRLGDHVSAGMTTLAWGAIGMFALAVSFKFTGRGEIIGLATAVLLVTASTTRVPALTRVLAAPVMLFIGSISYSIYLAHPLVIALFHSAGINTGSGFVDFLAIYAVTLLLSTMTYVVIERPTNRAGAWLANRDGGRVNPV